MQAGLRLMVVQRGVRIAESDGKHGQEGDDGDVEVPLLPEVTGSIET